MQSFASIHQCHAASHHSLFKQDNYLTTMSGFLNFHKEIRELSHYTRTVAVTTFIHHLCGNVIQKQVLFQMLVLGGKLSTHTIVKVWMSAMSYTHGVPWMILSRWQHRGWKFNASTSSVPTDYPNLHVNAYAKLVFSLWTSAKKCMLIAMIMDTFPRLPCCMSWPPFLGHTFQRDNCI